MRAIILAIVLALVLSFPVPAFAQSGSTYFVATANDTDDNVSEFSNEVHTDGWAHSITFEWTPNTEPKIRGYNLWSSGGPGGPYTEIEVDVMHADACNATVCTHTFTLKDPIVRVEGDLP